MVAEMQGYLREVVSARRRMPTDDMVSDLVRAEVDGASLSDKELIAFLFILFERLPGELTWVAAPTVRGPNELPVRFLSA